MDPNFEQELRTLLSQGQKIEAVKRYRERFDVGLYEAKNAIEALEQHGEIPEPSERDSAALERTIADLLEEGHKIPAIKLYRAFHGTGLKAAKDAVEAIAAERGLTVPKSGCLGVVLNVLVLVMGFAFRIME